MILTLYWRKEGCMLKARHEEYINFKDGLPFLLHVNINRSNVNYSKESNWHENLEIQLCNDGCGFALLNAEKYDIEKGDIIVANSDVIHYTGSNTNMSYSCLIIDTTFCQNIGIDPKAISIVPIIKDKTINSLFLKLKKVYVDNSVSYRTAKLTQLLLELLIELAENHSTPCNLSEINTNKNKKIKSVITYIHQNYNKKITLDEISKAVLYDKYALCREFKKYTGQTIIDNLNHYRCAKAAELLCKGYSVADASALCGFDNLSYFGKAFKKHMGCSPSKFKKKPNK